MKNMRVSNSIRHGQIIIRFTFFMKFLLIREIKGVMER